MKNKLFLRIAFAAVLGMTLGAAVEANAQMTDSQVVAYVKQANNAGKSQQQIAAELLAKGVTEAQINRIKETYTGGDSSAAGATNAVKGGVNRNSRQNAMDDDEYGYQQDGQMGGYQGAGQQNFYQPAPQKEKKPKLPEKDELANYLNDKYLQDPTLEKMDAAESFFTADLTAEDEMPEIFGHEIFRDRRINFEPNENAATPEDYKLGPNDEVIIEIWGYNEANIRETITPEGKINIDQIGPVYLNGLTIKEASEKIKRVLGSKYSGIDGERPNTEVSVSLGQIRTIQVNVMGEVETPGAFRLSPFSTVFTAIYRAGGVSDRGSLRNIKLVRGDKVVAQVDIYEYIFTGNTKADIRLQDGDVLIVPAYANLVKAGGNVKRPMHYEMKDGESLAKLIEYAGGFTGNAYTSSINVIRKSGLERSISSVSEDNAASFALRNGDEVKVLTNLDRYSNLIEIRGSVFHPGVYELGGDVATVRQLVEKAGGLKEDAFVNRAVIHREKDDLSFETVAVALGDIMSGARADVSLKKNDLLVISSKFDLENRGTLTINGQVTTPGTFPFAENTTIEDLILQAGGLLEGASLSKVDVSRRYIDRYGMEVPETLGETFTFSIKDGLVVDGGDRFVLEPYDVVSVRRSPAYQTQQFVTLEGEVMFPGEYVLQSKSERLSSVLNRAGGVTKHSFLHGGVLYRRTTEEQNILNSATNRLAQMSKDSLKTDQLGFEATYAIGIDMEKAVMNPGSIDDIILVEGDRIFIPENTNVVRITGEVFYPNVVIYQPGKTLAYYIDQAGGYSDNAKRSRAYVVYSNGHVTKASAAKFEPGCQIIVPQKKEKKALSATEIMSIGTSTASLATMIVSLVNMLAK